MQHLYQYQHYQYRYLCQHLYQYQLSVSVSASSTWHVVSKCCIKFNKSTNISFIQPVSADRDEHEVQYGRGAGQHVASLMIKNTHNALINTPSFIGDL